MRKKVLFLVNGQRKWSSLPHSGIDYLSAKAGSSYRQGFKTNLLAKIYEAYARICVRSIFLANRIFCKRNNTIPEKIKKILIINPQMIGDALMMSPALSALKKKFPNAIIDIVLTETSSDIYEDNPDVNNIFIYSQHFRKYLQLIKKIRKNNYNVLIDLQNTFSGLKRSILPLLCKIPYRISTQRGTAFTGLFPSVEIKLPDRHIALEYLSALSPLGINSNDTTLYISLSDKHKKWADNFLKSHNICQNDTVIGIHPSTKNILHRWTSAGFSEVAKHYLQKNCKIILTGLENESNQIEEILKKNPQIIYAKNISLKNFAALIARYDLLISIDTSSVHIAAATGTPTVVLIGPTMLKYWAPLNDKNQKVIQHFLPCKEKCVSGDANKVLPAERCIYKENYCLTKISSNEVIKTAECLLFGSM